MSANATNQRLFLSYARADDEPFVEKLCHDLRRLSFDPWYDRENMTNDGAPFTQAIGDAIRGSVRLLLVVGPRSVASQYCRGEWQKALAECVPVLPLLRLGDYDSIPAEIGKGHAIDCRAARDYGQFINELDRILRDPVRPLTSVGATPKLPPAYLVRPQYLEPLKQAIHSGDPLIAVTSKQETAALVGIGGIGKTTLAAALCHDCEVRRTFDQIHWINAGTTARTEDDAAALIWALVGGAPPGERGLNAARVAFARELHGKKTLLVVDDVWDVSVAQAFQFGGVDARTVITTRQRRIAEALGARSQAVDKLDEAEALTLLSGRAGRDLEADAAREIITLLDGHALAVGLAGAWLHKQRGKTAGDLLARLRARSVFPDLKLDVSDKNLNLELALKLSYDGLDAESQRHFRALGVTAQAGLTAAALGALWGIEDQFAAEDAVTVLSDAGLLDEAHDPEAGETRYDQHPLLRAYAAALLTAAGERDATFLRYAQYFTEQAEQFDTRPPETWRETIERDLAHVLAVGDALVVRANAAGVQSDVAALALAFAHNTTNFVFRRMEHQRREWLEMGLALSRAASDQGKEGLFLNELGLLWNALSEKHKALEYYEQALPIARAVGDRGSEATTLTNIGAVYRGLGELGKALMYYEQALPLYRVLGDRGGEATMLNNIGEIYRDLGEPHKALAYYEQALPILRAVGDRDNEARLLNNMGAVYRGLGEPSKALEYYEQALPLRRAVGDRGGEATTLTNIGEAYQGLGEPGKALEYLEQALLMHREVGNRTVEATTLSNIGMVWKGLGEPYKALVYYEKALLMHREVGNRTMEATTLNNMATIYFQEGNFARSANTFRQIIEIARAIGTVALEAAITANLAHTLERMGQRRAAIEALEQAIAIFKRVGLPYDAGGASVAQYEALLAQWQGADSGQPRKGLWKRLFGE